MVALLAVGASALPPAQPYHRHPAGPAIGVAWQKEINRCNKPRQASFLKNLLVSTCNKARLRGLGPGGPRAWGRGLQGLALGPKLSRLPPIKVSWWEAGEGVGDG